MNTSNKGYSRKTVGIACGLFLFAYGSCYHYLITDHTKPYVKRPNIEIPQSSPHTSNINNSGQRARKIIKSIKVVPTTETYEVSQWITSGDWSHDNYPLTITIPSQKVVMDIDYVEDHLDDFISDPEDEILYPPDIFQ